MCCDLETFVTFLMGYVGDLVICICPELGPDSVRLATVFMTQVEEGEIYKVHAWPLAVGAQQC